MSNPAYEKYIESLETTYKMLSKMVNLSPDENNYEGGRNINGEPHGFGKMIYADGNIYEGNWVNGNRSKIGKLTLSSGTIYEGEWANDKRNGQGKITYGEGSSYGHGNVYDGGWKDDEKHGEGVLTNALDNTELTQTWENGDLINSEGYGTIIVEVIEFNYGYLQFDDEKSEILRDLAYTGEIKNNIPNGKGIMIFPDEDRASEYNGNWRNGLFDGYGILSYLGWVYKGEWKAGYSNGQGTFSSSYGSSYEGDCKDGRFHGQGTYISQCGGSYEGEFKEGLYHGQGTRKDTYPDIFEEGEFRNNELWNGHSKEPYFEGSISNGKRVHGRVFSNTYDTFEWVEGNFSNDKIIGAARGKLKNGKIVDINGDGDGRITFK